MTICISIQLLSCRFFGYVKINRAVQRSQRVSEINNDKNLHNGPPAIIINHGRIEEFMSNPSAAREKQNDQRLDLKSTSPANNPADESAFRSPFSQRGLRTFPIARRCRSLDRGEKNSRPDRWKIIRWLVTGSQSVKRSGYERVAREIIIGSWNWCPTGGKLRWILSVARHKRIQFAQGNKGRTITTCIQRIRIVLGGVFAGKEKEGTCITRPHPRLASFYRATFFWYTNPI